MRLESTRPIDRPVTRVGLRLVGLAGVAVLAVACGSSSGGDSGSGSGPTLSSSVVVTPSSTATASPSPSATPGSTASATPTVDAAARDACTQWESAERLSSVEAVPVRRAAAQRAAASSDAQLKAAMQELAGFPLTGLTDAQLQAAQKDRATISTTCRKFGIEIPA